jgi:thymidylate kinase
VFLSEWNSSDLVKSATSRGKKTHLLTPTTFSLIHATDFADRYERQLLPLLRAGYVVLCDRYIFTAFARDVVRGCPPAWVRGLYSFAALPDVTFFLKAYRDVVGAHPEQAGRAQVLPRRAWISVVLRRAGMLPPLSRALAGSIPGDEQRVRFS